MGADFQNIQVSFQWEERKVIQNAPGSFFYAGGLRVKEIADYDANGEPVKFKRYDYRYQQDRNGDDQMETYSYGKRLSPITYVYNQIYSSSTNVTAPPYYYCANFVRVNSSVTQLNTSSGSPVGYDQVTEYWMDRTKTESLGKTVYEYENKVDSVMEYNLSPNYLADGLLGGLPNIRLPGIPNLAYKRNGTLRKKADYVKNGTTFQPIQETVNEYIFPLVDNYYSIKYESIPGGVGGGSKLLVCRIYPALKAERILLKRTVQKVYSQTDLTRFSQTETIYNYLSDLGSGQTHGQVIETISITDAGERMVERQVYPPDYGAVTTAAAGIRQLQEKHMIGMPVEKYVMRQNTDGSNSRVVSGVITTYRSNVANTSQVVADQVFQLETSAPVSSYTTSNVSGTVFNMDGRYRPRLRYDHYDGSGNVVQFTKSDGVPACYLWGYQNSLPIAQTVNADIGTTEQFADQNYVTLFPITANQSEFAPVSLPLDLNHAQTVTVTIDIQRMGAGPPPFSPYLEIRLLNQQGVRVFGDEIFYTGSVTRTLTLPAGVYTFYYRGSVYPDPANGYLGSRLRLEAPYRTKATRQRVLHTSFEEDGTADATAKTGRRSFQGAYTLKMPAQAGRYILSWWQKPAGGGNWTLTEQVQDLAANAPDRSLGDNNTRIDEVRLYPAEAQMTTYTYDPLVGMTSQTGPDNVTLHYEYDGSGRLKLVRDHKGNIVKNYRYRYRPQ